MARRHNFCPSLVHLSTKRQCRQECPETTKRGGQEIGEHFECFRLGLNLRRKHGWTQFRGSRAFCFNNFVHHRPCTCVHPCKCLLFKKMDGPEMSNKCVAEWISEFTSECFRTFSHCFLLVKRRHCSFVEFIKAIQWNSQM